MSNSTIEDIREKVVPILREAEIKKAALFGSFIRGDHTETSDVDILVDFPEDTTLIDVVRLQRNLGEKLHKKVDLVSYNAISPLLKDSILQAQYPLL